MVQNNISIVATAVAVTLAFLPNLARPQGPKSPSTIFTSQLTHESTFSPIHFGRFKEHEAIAPISLRTPKSYQAPKQTLRLEAVEAIKTHRTMKSVIVRVRNVTAEPQSAIIWYVLAVPEEPEPWRVYEHASEEVAFEVAAHQTLNLELEAPDVSLNGQYALSVWLHGLHAETRERFHSDSWEGDEPVSFAPPFSFSVDYLGGLEDEEGGFKVMVRFSVRNNKEERADVSFYYSISSPEGEIIPDKEHVRRAPEIPPGVSYVVTVRHDEILAQGQYVLTGWLYERIAGKYQLQATSSTPMELKRN